MKHISDKELVSKNIQRIVKHSNKKKQPYLKIGKRAGKNSPPQRKYSDGKQVSERRFRITSHKAKCKMQGDGPHLTGRATDTCSAAPVLLRVGMQDDTSITRSWHLCKMAQPVWKFVWQFISLNKTFIYCIYFEKLGDYIPSFTSLSQQ